jgi:hypothetical protein
VGEIVTLTPFVAPAVRVTLVVLNITGSPDGTDGDGLVRATVPANAFTLVMLMVALPVLPWGIDWEKGEAEIE